MKVGEIFLEQLNDMTTRFLTAGYLDAVGCSRCYINHILELRMLQGTQGLHSA